MALNREELIKYLENNVEIKGDCDVLEHDCKSIIFLLDNCEITVPESNRFFVEVNCSEIQNHIYCRRMKKFDSEITENGLSAGKVRIAHCNNEAAAQELKRMIRKELRRVDVQIHRCMGLCSYYAEMGGLLVGYEKF